ncbi:unnamed protein product [Symbiodinium sp. CCMP2592]|nr:unnamed protein product [Symbiodinium sp. CCMP2592]
MPYGPDALDALSLSDHPNLGGAPRTPNGLGGPKGILHEPEIFVSGSFSFCRRHHRTQLLERVSKACAIASPGPTPRAGLCEKRPGRYTQQLVSRAREAGLRVREVRTVDAVNTLATDLAQDDAASDIGLIVSCGSPVVLTEPVDLREHVAKTTAAMLQFPDAPVVGICYGMQLLTLLYGGKLAVDGVETVAGEVSAVLLPFFNAAIYCTDGVVQYHVDCLPCEDWRQFSSKQLTSALRALGRDQDWQAALRLLHDVQGSDSCRAETNIFSYGAAIAACERSAQWAWALQLLDDLITNGFEPNVIVWSSACSACDKAEHWLESLRLLNQMPGKKLQPNVISYGAALSACARVAKWQHAIALLEDVSAEDIDMNIVLWNSAITACARAGEWPLALQLLELLQQAGLQPDVLSFNACITAAGAGSRWQLALSLFDLAESVGRSVVTYNAVLAAFEAAGEWLPALTLLGPALGHSIATVVKVCTWLFRSSNRRFFPSPLRLATLASGVVASALTLPDMSVRLSANGIRLAVNGLRRICRADRLLAPGKGRAEPPGFRVIQISDEQDEQDEVILLQLGAPVFRRTSNSSTEFPAHCRTFGPDDGSPIASFPSGRHQLKDLMLCPEVKLIPPHVSLQAEWVSAKPRGLLWLPDSFNGVVPVAHATPDFLAYYGAAMASSCNTSAVDVKAEQQIVDFEYSYIYKERWVLNPDLGPGALGLQRHNFAHLECPLDDDNGILLLGKLVGKELHLTGFRCPCFHTIYLAPRVIHSKDHLLRRWRTSMTSVAEDALSTEVDHVLLQQMAESGGTVHDVDLRFEEAFNLVQQGPRACLKTTAKDGPRLSSLDEECEECDEDEAEHEQDTIPSQKPRPSVESLYTLMSSSTARVRVSVDSSASGVSAIFPGILPSLPLMPEAPSSRVEPPQLLVRHSGGTMEDRLGDAAYGKLLARMGHHASSLDRTRHRALPTTAREEHRLLQLQALFRCLKASCPYV